MTLEFQEYSAKKIVNTHKHVDGGWFWDKYSAHPYIGCRHGCEFCYSRGGPYLGGRDPDTYDSLIRVKTNAAALLRKELARLAPDVISCGDWQQPAESRYGLSRAMLEAVFDAGFPLLVIERSPALLDDLDLLQSIRAKSSVSVILSFSNVDPALKAAFEPGSPGLAARLLMMKKLAEAGIFVGMALMPILPLVGDDDAHIEEAIRAARDNGASFILASGLTMAGAQADRTLRVYQGLSPDWEPRIRQFFRWAPGKEPAYGPSPAYMLSLNRKVRALCEKYGLPDRMPRQIANNPLASNKRLAEKLFLKIHELELAGVSSYRIWAYRKAAWAVDELSSDVRELFLHQGLAGLRTIPGVGIEIANELAMWLGEVRDP